MLWSLTRHWIMMTPSLALLLHVCWRLTSFLEGCNQLSNSNCCCSRELSWLVLLRRTAFSSEGIQLSSPVLVLWALHAANQSRCRGVVFSELLYNSHQCVSVLAALNDFIPPELVHFHFPVALLWFWNNHLSMLCFPWHKMLVMPLFQHVVMWSLPHLHSFS